MSLRTRAVVQGLFAVAWLLLSWAAAAADDAHLDLALDLDPVTRRFDAVARFETTQGELRMRLHRSLAIRSVLLEDKPIAPGTPSVSGENAVWVVPLRGRGKVTVAYGGTLPAMDTGLDHRGVLRIAAPMASAEGSFLSSATYWYPRPRDRFAYRVTLTVPGAQRALVAGDMVDETLPSPADGRYRAVFEMKQPSDGIDLMAGPYGVEERILQRGGGAPLRLRTYFPPALREISSAYLDDSARYIDMYSKSIGAYPYRSFSIVASPLPTGFGMPTLTYMGADVLKLPFIRATSLGHEVLHNWWGNGVRPDYATGNWSEGLTTFMADYAYKERESPDAARDMRLAWVRDMGSVPAEARISLAQFRSRTHGAEAAAGYGKGAMVFFMLRDLIGAEAYERGIRAFWERYRFKTASWQDLQRTFEQASGTPLQTFFDQWLRRADVPQLAISDATAHVVNDLYRVTVTIAQQGVPYSVRVPLAVSSGERVETHIATVDQARNEVRFDMPNRPDAVRLDPDLRLWRLLQADELPPILRGWIVAPSPRYVVASSDPRVRDIAAKLARRLFESTPQAAADPVVQGVHDPLLIVGLHRDVDALLARLKLAPRPAVLSAAATAYVWTVPHMPHGAAPVAVISARDAAALEALMRPIPHYGAQSYLAFDEARLVTRGVWAVATPAVPVRLR
ncbi:MAG: M1 family metallopeptidase [Rhodospirillaceae bacterium]